MVEWAREDSVVCSFFFLSFFLEMAGLRRSLLFLRSFYLLHSIAKHGWMDGWMNGIDSMDIMFLGYSVALLASSPLSERGDVCVWSLRSRSICFSVSKSLSDWQWCSFDLLFPLPLPFPSLPLYQNNIAALRRDDFFFLSFSDILILKNIWNSFLLDISRLFCIQPFPTNVHQKVFMSHLRYIYCTCRC